jgi:rhamnulose-1-phosphate aldolase
MRDLARDPMCGGSIVRILDDCASYEIIADEPIVPTSEISSHLALQNYMLECGTDYKATLHTHPIELVAMSHNNEFLDSEHLTQVLWSMIPETLAFAPLGIGVVPYAMPSSTELVEPTLEKIKRYDVVLWEKHGVIAVGPDVMEAFDQIDVLNKAANIYMTAKNFGFTPDGMTPEAVQTIRTVFSLPDHR